MTAPIRNENDLSITPFGKWLHEEPELDSRRYKLNIQNIDYVVYTGHNATAYLMLIEEKRSGAEPNTAQAIMMRVLDAVLTLTKGRIAQVFGGQKVLYLGFHTVVFENDTPENGRIWWNGEQITRQQLIQLMRFDIDPRKVGRRGGAS